MRRFFWVGVVCVLVVFWVGCGDTFRPIIIPNPPAFPDPRAAHSVLSVNDNGTFSLGSGLIVDVSGDTRLSQTTLGLVPVHAVQQPPGNRVIVVNQATNGSVGDSLTLMSFLGTQVTGTSTIGLPTSSAPNFIATTEANQAYVSLPNNVPPSVAVVNTQSNSIVAFIPVETNPVAMAETPDGKKLYVANQGSGTVSAFNTLDRSPRSTPINVSSPPIWLEARSDSARVFILESNGTLAYLDTTSTSGPDPLTETSIQVPGAISFVYDTILNRFYIPGGGVLAIVDASGAAPLLLNTISVPQIPGIPAVNATAVAVTPLPDGSRAYVTSVSQSAQPTNVSVSGVTGDGATATYTYTLTSGHDVAPGIVLSVSNTQTGFDGMVTVSAVLRGTTNCPSTCFQATNSTVLAQTAVTGSGASVVDNIFPQVTVINTSNNSIKVSAIPLPGFPDATNSASPYFAPVCATTRFRFGMAAAGDSTKVYMSSCDGGSVNVIRTSDDTFVLNIAAPSSVRTPIPPDVEPPPQNPVFLLAGP